MLRKIVYPEPRARAHKKPLAYLNLNIGADKVEKILLHEGDDPNEVSQQICEKYGINEKGREIMAHTIKAKLAEIATTAEGSGSSKK